jgi:hypothetical protein
MNWNYFNAMMKDWDATQTWNQSHIIEGVVRHEIVQFKQTLNTYIVLKYIGVLLMRAPHFEFSTKFL